MEKTRGGRVTFDPERVVMAGGATGANETIIFCLADAGDAFLVPSPYYPAYVFSFYLLYFHFFCFLAFSIEYISFSISFYVDHYIKGK